MKKNALRFLSLGLILIGLGSCRQATESTKWQAASQYFEDSQILTSIITENTSLSLSELGETTQVRPINEELVIVDFNSPQLCGQLGCAYALYEKVSDRQWRRVFADYLNPALPSGIPLVEVKEEKTNEKLPCLIVNQVAQHQDQGSLQQVTLCFADGRYQVIEENLIRL